MNYNQVTSHEQDQLTSLLRRIQEATSKTYGQPGETHGPDRNTVDGLRPAVNGDPTLGIHTELLTTSLPGSAPLEVSQMLWRNGPDGLVLVLARDTVTGHVHTEVRALHQHRGGQDADTIHNPMVVAATMEYATRSLDALEPLEVSDPSAS